MNAQTLGLIGGIAGGVLGIIGGIIGSYFSIKNTAGPHEKKFMIKTCICVWVLVIILFLCVFLIPKPYGFLAFAPYAVILPVGISILNKRQKEIREEELHKTE